MKMPISRQKPLETHFSNFPARVYDSSKNGKFDKTELTEWGTVAHDSLERTRWKYAEGRKALKMDTLWLIEVKNCLSYTP